MKKLLYLPLIVMMSIAVLFSCNDDDDDTSNPPTFIGAEISADNATITLTFDMAVYGDANASEMLTPESLHLSIAGGTATISYISVTHGHGDEIAYITVHYEGTFSGDEVITITPVSIYNSEGIMMATTEEVTVTCAEIGIIGEWYSSGTNVAPLLSTYFNVDSIYAKFNDDQTYVVESYDPDGVVTEYVGTYTQTKSSVGNIYTIELNQSAPSVVVSEGIFEVTLGADGYDMQYEVVQMEPDLGNSPPTADGGFGSSNGGALGTINIQKYLKIN